MLDELHNSEAAVCSMRFMECQQRVVDGIPDDLFPHLAAIALEGAKGVGKTATASPRANTILVFNRPGQREDATPGIRSLPVRARQVQLDSYLGRIVEKELPENGVTVRQPGTLNAWLTAYGAAAATDASCSAILDAVTAGDKDKPARGTVDSYREHLRRVFVLDPIPAWNPVINPLKRLTSAPKHHLVDSALAARLVGIGNDGLRTGEGHGIVTPTGTWLGAFFESLAAQSVRVYADAVGAQIGHLRTKDTTREIDLIVEGGDRQVAAVEVKLAATVSGHDVRHLNWLRDQIGGRLSDQVVITTDEYAYRRRDGVAVVPLVLLGP